MGLLPPPPPGTTEVLQVRVTFPSLLDGSTSAFAATHMYDTRRLRDRERGILVHMHTHKQGKARQDKAKQDKIRQPEKQRSR